LTTATKWICLVLLLFTASNSHAIENSAENAAENVVEKKAVDFTLNNWDGKTVTLNDLKNKVIVLTFSYSYCSVRCPVVTARLSSLDYEINASKDVVYLHVSVDPDMDTPERRLNYFQLYGIDAVKDNRWMFVSGKKEELSKLWKFYGIEIDKIEENRIPEGYYIQYTPKVVVISKDRLIKLETDFYLSEEEVAKTIKGLK